MTTEYWSYQQLLQFTRGWSMNLTNSSNNFNVQNHSKRAVVPQNSWNNGQPNDWWQEWLSMNSFALNSMSRSCLTLLVFLFQMYVILFIRTVKVPPFNCLYPSFFNIKLSNILISLLNQCFTCFLDYAHAVII